MTVRLLHRHDFTSRYHDIAMTLALAKYLRVTLFFLPILLLLASNNSAATSNCDQTPARASAALYERMSARDLAGVLQLIPEQGFSETGTEGSVVHQLDRKAFETLFKTDLSIQLRAENLRAQQIGDMAIVTGVRIGAISASNVTPKLSQQVFTMIWVRDQDQCDWKLRHLHLSTN